MLQLKVVLRELSLLLSFFPNEKTLLSIPLNSDFILLKLGSLFDIKLKDLHKPRVSVLLRALEVETLVELHLGKQVIDVLGLVIKLIGVPLAIDAVLVIHHLFALI